MTVSNKTLTHLEWLAQDINNTTNMPMEYWNEVGNTLVGHYFIKKNGDYILCRITNKNGACENVLRGKTKRDLYNLMNAYLEGYKISQL